ncbi:MAG: hypothetical protein ACYDCC_00665 [Actinomycetota bacterium]
MRVSTTWTAILLLVFAGACSKSGTSQPPPLSHADFIAKANQICKSVSDEIAKENPPGDPSGAKASDLSAWADYFDKTIPLAQDGLSKLKALVPPSADAASASAALDSIETQNMDATQARDAAKAGNLDQFKTLAAKLGSDNNDGNKLASDAGLTECAK